MCLAPKAVGVASYLPAGRLDNNALAERFSSWSSEKILEKTGIKERRIAAEGETATDLAVAAAETLFEQTGYDRSTIDFLILCTQAPDYVLPTSACLVQDRLGLQRSVGALDINLGCSGFVYGLSLASGLIASGSASRILLLTADTYSKFINPGDRSVRILFGDGAAATLVEADDQGASIGPFVFGTDGRGVMVEAGGARVPRTAETGMASEDEFGNVRSRNDLYMDGSAVLSFTLGEVPKAFAALKERASLSDKEIDLIVMHQNNKFMLDALVKKMGVPGEKVPYWITGATIAVDGGYTAI